MVKPLQSGESRAQGGAHSGAETGRERFDVERLRRDFPALGLTVHGRPLAYLDSAATSQKPRPVLDAERLFYEEACANVHRGVHALSERATAIYEGARETVRRCLGAAEAREIVLLRGTTEAVNLVASSFGRRRVGEGDEVLVTEMEHHSNIVPWQILCEAQGARLEVAPFDDRGELILEEYERRLGERTRMVAIGHVSNALGTINPVQRMIELAHERGIPVLVDGAQAVPHFEVDVRELDCDFYAFSGHKAFAPTGIGALYGKLEHLEAMPPYQGGGEMISRVSFAGTEFREPPARFEAGTPNIAGAAGLAAALEYLEDLDREALAAHERDLLEHAVEALAGVPGIRLVGTATDKVPVVSFLFDGVHAHDVGTVLDREGVAVRTGHHCAQPVMDHFGVAATTRASFAFYNTRAEADRLAAGLARVAEMFGR